MLSKDPPSSHQSVCRLTQSLVKQVEAEAAQGVNWLSSRHFPDLAASFNVLMRSGNLMSSLDMRNLPLVRRRLGVTRR